MIKLVLAATFFTTIAIPAMAMDVMCDDASMKMAQAKVDAMTDTAMKENGMKEMSKAGNSAREGNKADCKEHLVNAMTGKM